ncbi:hypothetical protein [Microbacterium sp. gxy059]|uniref:hypothetical protein n=1 Tax=Microbacterium sp. gxy059 TaxID=2957199 RepID=UPI003D961792
MRPWTYPGTRPDRSVLIAQDVVAELVGASGAIDGTGRDRVEDLRVAGLPGSEGEAVRLSAELARRGGAPLADRVPVLAIGSNAAPAQLRHKFADGPALAIPSIRARAQGISVGFCAFLAPLGYVPATATPSPGARTRIALQLVDDAQLDAIDRTEAPRYRRVLLETPLLLDTGETIRSAYAYAALGGVIGESRGIWMMRQPGEEDPEGDAERRIRDQADLRARLAARGVALSGDIDVDRPALDAAGLIRPNPLADLPDAIGRAPLRWRDVVRDRP